MSQNTVAVSDATFKSQVLEAKEPVLVDFWAEWCGPCKMIGPALEELAAEYKGRVTVAKVNIDENPASPNNYGVRGIPTLILFKDGKPVLGFASMGSGLHQRTLQALLNVTEFGMSVREAIDAPDFFLPGVDPATQQMTVLVPKGRFDRSVLDALGYPYEERAAEDSRFAEGIWVAISRDPATGRLEAASHNRNNSAAVAF